MATLPALAFEGATRRNRPNLAVSGAQRNAAVLAAMLREARAVMSAAGIKGRGMAYFLH